MAAQRGKDLLLKIDRGTGGIVTVAGLRARAITFDSEKIDTTSQDSSGLWRELMSGARVKTARIQGTGIFKDAASDALLRQAFFDGSVLRWQVVIPDFGIVAGPFQLTSLAFAARHDAEVTFELTLESAGDLQFTEL